MEFRKEKRFAELLNPLRGYEAERQEVEHRYDPLTGRETVVTVGRFGYAKRFFETDRREVQRLAEETERNCPFCPPRLRSATPLFPDRVVRGGTIRVGGAVLFPGLFAHIEHNAIVILGEEHYLTPGGYGAKILDAFLAGLAYLRRLRELHSEPLYASFLGNYLPLSGSTIVHPHMQVVASDLPFQLLAELLERSREYLERSGRNYWVELIGREEGGERWVGRAGGVAWLTPFAPSSTYEVWGISEHSSSILELGEGGLGDFAEGLGRVLRFYEEEGLSCFNFSLYSPLQDEARDYFRVGMRVIARFGYRPPYVSDTWSLQAILGLGEAYDAPEEVARKLRGYFAH